MSPEEQLAHVHWHILRGDSLRGSVASRAGTVLSTNALVIGGIVLAFGLHNHKPSPYTVALGAVTLGCVAVSVFTAAQAATTSVRKWRSTYPKHPEHGGTPYSYIEIDSGASNFEDFKRLMTEQTPEKILEDAIAEQWQNNFLHRDRYMKLRMSLRWLLAAVGLLLCTTIVSALT